MLKYRVVSGATLIALFSLMVFWKSVLASVLFLALSVIVLSAALVEFFAILSALGYPGYRLLSMTAGLAAVGSMGYMAIAGADLAISYGQIERLIAFSFISFAFICAFSERDYKRGVLAVMTSCGAYLYLIWALGFMVKIYFMRNSGWGSGPFLFLFFILITKSGDIGGYTFGKLLARRAGGNHLLTPRLSPNKSWEGLWGSLVLSTTVAGAFSMMPNNLVDRQLFNMPLTSACMVGALLAVVGLIGDLSVSMLKRAAMIKDSGRIVPGMGGVLDVIDSLILASPLFYWILTLRG